MTIAPRDGSCDYAIDGSDGVEELLAVALSSTFGRAVRAALEPRLDSDGWQAVLDEARASCAPSWSTAQSGFLATRGWSRRRTADPEAGSSRRAERRDRVDPSLIETTETRDASLTE